MGLFSALGNLFTKGLNVASIFSPQAAALKAGVGAVKGTMKAAGQDLTNQDNTVSLGNTPGTPQTPSGAPQIQWMNSVNIPIADQVEDQLRQSSKLSNYMK